jgi:hypothetical protein
MNQPKIEKTVEAIFQDGRACLDCQYLRTWREPRGEFWGAPCSETMSACGALENGHPEWCPELTR